MSNDTIYTNFKLLTASGLSGSLGGSIVLLSLDELITALGSLDVGKGDMDLLVDHSAVNLLLDLDSDGSLGDVEDDTGAAMVVLERHTLVDGRIHLDIHIVSTLLKIVKYTR
jgi:hypothetical protein